MIELHKYLPQISQLNPLENSKFEYKTKTWSKLNNNLKAHLFPFENNFISRKDVVDSFIKYYEGNLDFMVPFGLTMVWGFADTGYGTHRTNKYCELESNRINVQNSFEYIKNNEIEKAYRELQNINGLNISYISKLLYFATRAMGTENYCLIYDIRVAKSLVKLSCPPEIYEILDIKPSKKFHHYRQYNELMHSLSLEHNVSAESLEIFLFNQYF